MLNSLKQGLIFPSIFETSLCNPIRPSFCQLFLEQNNIDKYLLIKSNSTFYVYLHAKNKISIHQFM